MTLMMLPDDAAMLQSMLRDASPVLMTEDQKPGRQMFFTPQDNDRSIHHLKHVQQVRLHISEP
jgi:hypothetical protein